MSLGSTLKEARLLIPLTLRQVEEAAGISNAYLSQLENDKIQKPSANILYKLSSLYKVDLKTLLKAAGIIQQSEESTDESKVINNIAFYAENLSKDDAKKVLEFMKFLRHQKKEG